jgi:hypothetical protein
MAVPPIAIAISAIPKVLAVFIIASFLKGLPGLQRQHPATVKGKRLGTTPFPYLPPRFEAIVFAT